MQRDVSISEFQVLVRLLPTGQMNTSTEARARGIQLMARLPITGKVDDKTMAAARRLAARYTTI